MRRATKRAGTCTVLAFLTIGAASLFSLRAHPGPHPASLTPLSIAGALRPNDHRFAASPAATAPRLLRQAPSRERRARLANSYGKLPLTFIANRGQLDRRVAYYVPGRDKSLYFTKGGVTFALAGKSDDQRPT